MKPYLLCVNLNGMVVDGPKRGMMILPLGQGDLELQLLKTIVASGYRGPIGILNHTGEDAEARLQDNLRRSGLAGTAIGRPAGRPEADAADVEAETSREVRESNRVRETHQQQRPAVRFTHPRGEHQ